MTARPPDFIKLRNALFKTPFKFFRVKSDFTDDLETFEDWELEPLKGETLAPESANGPLEGHFILAGKAVSGPGVSEDCYLDVVLPERICEYRYVLDKGAIKKMRGRRGGNSTAVPVVPIEKFGVPQLFYARENPDFGIEVLEKGLKSAKEKKYIAYDLGVLLRNEKKYERAIEAFSVVLDEDPTAEICRSVYQERSQLYKALGQFEKAEEDRRRWAIAFERKFGHPPSAQESF